MKKIVNIAAAIEIKKPLGEGVTSLIIHLPERKSKRKTSGEKAHNDALELTFAALKDYGYKPMKIEASKEKKQISEEVLSNITFKINPNSAQEKKLDQFLNKIDPEEVMAKNGKQSQFYTENFEIWFFVKGSDAEVHFTFIENGERFESLILKCKRKKLQALAHLPSFVENEGFSFSSQLKKRFYAIAPNGSMPKLAEID